MKTALIRELAAQPSRQALSQERTHQVAQMNTSDEVRRPRQRWHGSRPQDPSDPSLSPDATGSAQGEGEGGENDAQEGAREHVE